MKMEVPSPAEVIKRTLWESTDLILETDLDVSWQAIVGNPTDEKFILELEDRIEELERCKIYRPQLGPL
jgi:hypothetical protein